MDTETQVLVAGGRGAVIVTS